MVLLKLLIFTLTFNKLIIDVDAKTCPKGQRTSINGLHCENCPDGLYQPEENDSKRCEPCTKCDGDSGSDVKVKCTAETNTICECRGKFVPSDSDSSTCKCDIGFGKNQRECEECEEGYFSKSINSRCEKWKVCKSGVNITGTKTSDVICNDDSKSTYVTTSPVSNRNVPLITRLTPHHPLERSTDSPNPTSAPEPAVTSKDPIGMALLIFGIVGLLVLTTVTCKLHITFCMPRKPPVQPRDSLCRKPVEESGNGSLSSLKLNPEEP
ncbi:tumor necrosis factor receptor superfamily member 4 [Micropterus salmoides]|uniref:tumor necrosis factor receptor superfamily member 4 n=1 Tax=Micropterus salmoides TaxID=27706 RepID=UPI0018EE1FB4|nr:tumor necrosis factor receptor superfamily member 4 [Micropterus salmoides]